MNLPIWAKWNAPEFRVQALAYSTCDAIKCWLWQPTILNNVSGINLPPLQVVDSLLFFVVCSASTTPPFTTFCGRFTLFSLSSGRPLCLPLPSIMIKWPCSDYSLVDLYIWISEHFYFRTSTNTYTTMANPLPFRCTHPYA